MKKEQKQKKKKIDWKRTFKNNGYMLGLIIKACPSVPILALISTVLGSVHSFLLNTYLYQYALNALQEGKELKIILITLGCMFGYSVLYMLFGSISSCYFELKYPKVEAYIQNLLQKKAIEVDLACFESSAFYDTYVKATGEATNRSYTVMNNILDIIWITINVVAVGTLIITIDHIFLLLAFLPFLCTLLIGKKRNRIKYEDNVSGKLSDDHFSKMSIIYEDEQREKKVLAEQLRAELDKDKEQNDGIEKFIAKVKAITDIQELTPEIVREFISRFDVYAPYRKDKQRHQNIDIYYHGVGYVFIPEPEEVEEMFQEHLRDRKENIKEKTA